MTNNYDFALKYGAGATLFMRERGELFIDGARTGESGLCRISSCSQPPTHKTFYDSGGVEGTISENGWYAYCEPCAFDRKVTFPKRFTMPTPLGEDTSEEEWA